MRTLLTPERVCEPVEDPLSMRARELSVARSEFASTISQGQNSFIEMADKRGTNVVR